MRQQTLAAVHTHTHTHGYSKEQIKWIELGNIGCVRMCKRILKNQTNTETGIPFYKIGTRSHQHEAEARVPRKAALP